MRKWGFVITLFYVIVLLLFLLPMSLRIAFPGESHEIKEVYNNWLIWILVGVLLAGEIMLLSLSVDTTRKKLRPRGYFVDSAIISAMLFALLTFAILWCVAAAYFGETIFEWRWMQTPIELIVIWAFIWIIWGILFYRFCRNRSDFFTKAISWLFRGSVLELLIAVPCHVIVRHRKDCSAPLVTSFGITTGIAIMLLSFGPSVLLLYKKRLDEYSQRKTEKTA